MKEDVFKALKLEELEPLAELVKHLPGKGVKHPHPATICRWINKGVKLPDGRCVRLEAIRHLGRWLSTKAAITTFVQALNSTASPAMNVRMWQHPATPGSRAHLRSTTSTGTESPTARVCLWRSPRTR